MKTKTDNKTMSRAIGLGVTLGILVGVLTDNIGLWLPLGIAIGGGSGKTWAKRESNS